MWRVDARGKRTGEGLDRDRQHRLAQCLSPFELSTACQRAQRSARDNRDEAVAVRDRLEVASTIPVHPRMNESTQVSKPRIFR